MDTKRLEELIKDETVESLDYNLKENFLLAKSIILGQWKAIYEALMKDDDE